VLLYAGRKRGGGPCPCAGGKFFVPQKDGAEERHVELEERREATLAARGRWRQRSRGESGITLSPPKPPPRAVVVISGKRLVARERRGEALTLGRFRRSSQKKRNTTFVASSSSEKKNLGRQRDSLSKGGNDLHPVSKRSKKNLCFQKGVEPERGEGKGKRSQALEPPSPTSPLEKSAFCILHRKRKVND